jgi:homoserine O-acetyltransferase
MLKTLTVTDHSTLKKPLVLERGRTLENVTIAFQTYGKRDTSQNNAVLAFHALTGGATAGEWWSEILGEEYFVISPNCIGSCYGSTGPESIDPQAGKPYHADFPEITIRDIARSTLLLLDELGIENISLAIGGSFGGMIVFELALLAPGRIRRIAPISCGAEHTAWRIAFSSVIRKIIEEGIANGNTDHAFELARQVAMISYRSSGEFEERFARDRNISTLFEVESYLEHQGKKIVERFSPYSYIALTRAMENYSIFEGRRGSREQIISQITQPSLLLGANSDILYPESELRELAQILPKGIYYTLDAPWGHDSFLLAEEQLKKHVQHFLIETDK